MANDGWKRFREKQLSKPSASARAKAESLESADVLPKDLTTEDLESMIEKIEPLVEQINNLYNQYFHGTEKRVPIERRKVLVNLLAKVEAAPKSNLQIKFRCSNAIMLARNKMELWDKRLRKLEMGLIRRKAA